MRIDPPGSLLTQPKRDPRVVLQIVYPVGSIYLTNRTGIANVPGTVVAGVLREVSSVSQRLLPTEGRVMVGSLDFTLVDVGGAVTEALRSQLQDEFEGLRHREVRLFTGDTDDYTDGTWRRVATYIIDGHLALADSKYRFSCSDLNRELRRDILDFKRTKLAAPLAVGDTSVTVVDASAFTAIAHTSSFTESPLQTVGYLYFEKTGEIVRWRNKVDNGDGTWTFLECEREIANTIAVGIELDGGDAEQWPEVQEFIYLEMPGPDLLHTLLTGQNIANTLQVPEHWHLGIATSLIDVDSFSNIGRDLYDPSNADGGFVLRFLYRQRVDGKRFIEEQVLRPLWCFTMVTPEGKLRLRRITSVLSTSASIRQLFEGADLIGRVEVRQEWSELVNELVVDWNYNGEKFTRTNVLLNLGSQLTHKKAASKALSFEGLTVNRHQTAAVLQKQMDSYAERFGAPPYRFTAKLSRRHNDLEVGDVVWVVLQSVRDYTAESTFSRACEIQSISVNWMSGDTVAEFFASTTPTYPDKPATVSARPLADSFWPAVGQPISSVLTVVGNVVTAGGTLTGNADMRASGAVYYHEGPLTINADVNVTQNVQLRVRGNLHINARIDGVGRGIAAVADPNTVGSALVFPSAWTSPTLGLTRGGGGIIFTNGGNFYVGQGQPVTLRGLETIPRVTLVVEGGQLLGIPAEARGTPGQYGAPVYDTAGIVRALGGPGGDGGAGLVIICESLTFGVDGEIDLSGEAGATPSADYVHAGNTLRAGTGGGGAPGGVYVFLADRSAALPDLAAAFTADHGSAVVSGNPIGMIPPDAAPASPWTGSVPGIGAADHWLAMQMVQWIPPEQDLGEGSPEVVPAPRILSATPTEGGVLLLLDPPAESQYDVIDIFGSITNNLEDATLLESNAGAAHTLKFDGVRTMFLWVRARQGAVRSAYSSGSTDGYQVTGGAPIVPQIALSDLFAETFDAYETAEDFYRDWQPIGMPTAVSFPRNGVDGGKALRVEGYGFFLYRKNIPFEPEDLYRLEARFRSVVANSSGVQRLSLGFLGVKADGTTLIDSQGNDGYSIPPRQLVNSYNLEELPALEWRRALAWLTGISTNSDDRGLSGSTDYAPLSGQTPHEPCAMTSSIVDSSLPKYLRPYIEINRDNIVANTATSEVDHIIVRRRPLSDAMLPALPDQNFSLANDAEFWNPNVSSSSSVFPEFAYGEGIESKNAIRMEMVGGGQSRGFVSRYGVSLRSDTITIRVSYRVQNLGPTINAATRTDLTLWGYRRHPTLRGRYTLITGSIASSHYQEVLLSALTVDNTWRQRTYTFTGIYADALLDDADLIVPRFQVFTDPSASTDNFIFWVGRMRLSQS